MTRRKSAGKIIPCPGLKITANAGISWTDSAARVHELATVRLLTRTEVAGSALFRDIGISTEEDVSRLITRGDLYPVFRKNARVVRVFECALPDYRARCFGARRPLKAVAKVA